MKLHEWKTGLIIPFLLCSLLSPAQAGDDISGVWWSPRKDAKLEMKIDTQGRLSGRLIAIPEKDASQLDSKNPDPVMRNRSLLGLTVFSGFVRDTQNQWSQGQVYDAELGATFQAKIWLEDDDRLMVRGYLGLPLFGRTEIFQRVKGPQPSRPQAGEPTLRHLETSSATRPNVPPKGPVAP